MSGDAAYSAQELVACVVSREFVDGERVMLGANVPAGRAGLLLAHLLRCPNMRLMLAFSWRNFVGTPNLTIHPLAGDHRNSRGAEAYISFDVLLNDLTRFFSNVFIVGGLQVDRFGNSNLIGLGDDHSRLRLRGPGAVGTAFATAYADRFYIMPVKHTREVFVERCDFVSSVGWDKGGKDARKRLGLRGGGPKLCVTEICVFDFDDDTKAMRLKSLHPGRTVEDVIANTGFDVIIPPSVPETDSPRPEELMMLRTVIDTDHQLRDPDAAGSVGRR